jgi:uncharacterized protein
MSIQQRLNEDLKAAMRSGDKLRVEVIRMTNAALKNAQMAAVKQAFDAVGEEGAEGIDNKQALSDQAVQDVVMKEVKRRREAAELFRKGGRMDLVQQEEAEAVILEEYLPRMLSAEELRPLVSAIIEGLGVSGPAAMNKVMPAAMQQLKGQADGRVINQVVRELLSQ